MSILPTVDTILGVLEAERASGRSIVFVSGKFNIVHPGHLRLLKFAAEQASVLVIGILPDGASGVSIPASLRLEALRGMALIRYAFVLDEPLDSVLRRIRPNFVVKGKEYENRENPEADVLAEYGGRLVFGSGEVSFSSLALLRREYFDTDHSTIEKPLDFPQRHGFSASSLKKHISSFEHLRVLVVGDLIIDSYIDCEPLGMSQEDPTIVVSPIERQTFVGGAGIVAAHVRALGARTSFVTVCGEDTTADFARRELAKYDVDATLIKDSTRPTTKKERFRAQGKTLLRINHLRQRSVDAELARKIVAAVKARLDETDLILFSDFNYGCLPQGLVDAISASARDRGVMMAADSQASSQVSDISRFKDMTIVTPTEHEARLAVRDAESGLIVIAERLKKVAKAKHVLITLGGEGLLMYVDTGSQPQADRLPAFNTAPKDVAGAGDCLFACSAMSLCAGFDIWQSAYLGSLAAACQVSRVGNLPLKASELCAEIDRGWASGG